MARHNRRGRRTGEGHMTRCADAQPHSEVQVRRAVVPLEVKSVGCRGGHQSVTQGL